MINSINLITHNYKHEYKKSSNNNFLYKSQNITFRASSHANFLKDLSGSPFSVCRKITQKIRSLFNWPTKSDLACKRLEDEVNELKIGIQNNEQINIREEIGDILFVLSDIAEINGITLEDALKHTNAKIIQRVESMERMSPKPLNENTVIENKNLWNKAKIKLKDNK